MSPVGARGLAQFMPATWRDMEKRFGGRASPHDDISIEYGAYYMSRKMHTWRRDRPKFEQWRLGLASYNAGTGNIIKAQSLCDNRRTWSEISKCLHRVTGDRNSHETKTYVPRIERWWSQLAEGKPWEMPVEMRRESTRDITQRIVEKYNVSRFFNGNSWCTYWQPWPVNDNTAWVSADHCHVGMDDRQPFFISGLTVHRTDNRIDAVFYGKSWPRREPSRMTEGEDVYILGYPGGSDIPSLRLGTVYLQRIDAVGNYSMPSTIVMIPAPSQPVDDITSEPVIGGMSGGVVVTVDGLKAKGILVTQNGQVDLNGDGLPDNSADVVSLNDLWRILNEE